MYTSNPKHIIYLIVAILVLFIGGTLIYQSKENKKIAAVTNFEECIQAGYPIMESYPRQCRTPDGRSFVESIDDVNPMPGQGAVATGGCFIGGCSAQICSDEKDAPSTCEFRPEYACYQTGVCERQENGACGWRKTDALIACLDADYDRTPPKK